MLTIESKGSFKNTEAFLNRMKKNDILTVLNRAGQQGVEALSRATPTKTGRTASAWTYEVISERGSYSIVWSNTNVVNGVPIAVLIQYGHGTGTGGYVQGRDYINPAIRPIFDQLASDVWKAVTSA